MGKSKTGASSVEAAGTTYAGDNELVAALRRKNRKAAADFVSLHADQIHAYVHSRLVPRADLIDDMVQEVFLAAWGDLHRFQGRSSLRSWLLGIARHKVEDYYRARLRRPDALDIDDASEPIAGELPIEEAIDRKRTRERTRKILGELPETYGLLLLWRYWEQRSVREMADGIGRTEKAVERALARARLQFRRKWEHTESEHGR